MDLRKRILDTPSYWVESINAKLYEAIINFKEANNYKQKDLANIFGISTGRVSQILNDGEINFSIEKLIEISLKVNKFPILSLIDKEEYLSKEREDHLKNVRQVSFDLWAKRIVEAEFDVALTNLVSSKTQESKSVSVSNKTEEFYGYY